MYELCEETLGCHQYRELRLPVLFNAESHNSLQCLQGESLLTTWSHFLNFVGLSCLKNDIKAKNQPSM
jgi:hypothetical protein